MSALQQDIYNQIKFRTKHLQHGWAYFTLDEVLRHDKVVPAWVYENPQLKKDRWTGLLDKEQKEIYEGDIVEYDGTDKGWATTLNNGRYKVRIDAVKGIELVGYYEPSYVHLDGFFGNFEVIGNIYEQPNLLPIQPKK